MSKMHGHEAAPAGKGQVLEGLGGRQEASMVRVGAPSQDSHSTCCTAKVPALLGGHGQAGVLTCPEK